MEATSFIKKPCNIALYRSTEIIEIFQWTKDNSLSEGKREKFEEELADLYFLKSEAKNLKFRI